MCGWATVVRRGGPRAIHPPLPFAGPVVVWIERAAVHVAASNAPGVFELRLGSVMARLAQGLPVGLVEEQRLVTAVRHLVVNHRGQPDLVRRRAKLAQWVGL